MKVLFQSKPKEKTVIVEKDIFDELETEKDIFDEVILGDKNVLKKIVPPTKEEIAKRADENKLIERIKREVLASIKIPSAPPPEIKIVEKIVEKEEPEVEEGPDEDDIKFEEMKTEIEKLKASLEDQTKKVKTMEEAGPVFIPAAPIIPSWSGQSGKYLTNNGDQLKWATAQTGTEGYITLGDGVSNGSWRLFISDTSLLVQRLESGTWTEKGAFLA